MLKNNYKNNVKRGIIRNIQKEKISIGIKPKSISKIQNPLSLAVFPTLWRLDVGR